MSTDTTETPEYMSAADFATKVDLEGGIFGALEYGLHADDLDPDDPASATLREAWAELEKVHREHWAPVVRKVSDALHAFEDLDEYDGEAEA